jgi:hypothetical protein
MIKLKVTKRQLADALHSVIKEYEEFYQSEFETTRGIPEHNNKQINNAKALWNKYILHTKTNKK